MDQIGLDKGYFVTSSCALLCNYFSSAFQSESKFGYLGDQKIGTRDTYVVGFAQQPGKATVLLTMKRPRGARVNMLVQGIAWTDRRNFQIIQMRTDLLSPRSDMGLDQQPTEVTHPEVQLVDVSTSLWLPSAVKIDIEFRSDSPNFRQSFVQSF